MAKIVKETIHAKGIDIGIYTTNIQYVRFAVKVYKYQSMRE